MCVVVSANEKSVQSLDAILEFQAPDSASGVRFIEYFIMATMSDVNASLSLGIPQKHTLVDLVDDLRDPEIEELTGRHFSDYTNGKNLAQLLQSTSRNHFSLNEERTHILRSRSNPALPPAVRAKTASLDYPVASEESLSPKITPIGDEVLGGFNVISLKPGRQGRLAIRCRSVIDNWEPYVSKGRSNYFRIRGPASMAGDFRQYLEFNGGDLSGNTLEFSRSFIEHIVYPSYYGILISPPEGFSCDVDFGPIAPEGVDQIWRNGVSYFTSINSNIPFNLMMSRPFRPSQDQNL